MSHETYLNFAILSDLQVIPYAQRTWPNFFIVEKKSEWKSDDVCQIMVQ